MSDYSHLRNKVLPSHLSQDEEDPYALIYVINDAKDAENNLPPEEDILQASINALVKLFLDPRPVVQEPLEKWMSGRIRKIAKRARNSAWDKVTMSSLPLTEGAYRNAKVRVFAPIRISEQPAELKKLQVTGLQATFQDTTFTGENTPYLEISVDASLNMTTGKLIAQIGHAVQLFIMFADEKRVSRWLSRGNFIRVVKTDRLPAEETCDAVVHDAGFTEVASGSLTCVAIYKDQFQAKVGPQP